jgi:hypothetical protein
MTLLTMQAHPGLLQRERDARTPQTDSGHDSKMTSAWAQTKMDAAPFQFAFGDS